MAIDSADQQAGNAPAFTASHLVNLPTRAKNFPIVSSLAVFIVSISLVLIASHLLWKAAQEKAANNQKIQHSEKNSKIANLIRAPLLSLMAVSKHVETEEQNTDESFSKFIGEINLLGQMRGIESVGIIRATINSSTQGIGIQVSKIQHSSNNDIEQDARFFKQPVLLAAMERAYLSSSPIVSKSVFLDSGESNSRGFVYFSPVYRAQGGALNSNGERKFVGFVYAKLNLSNLLNEVNTLADSTEQFDLFEQQNDQRKVVFTSGGNKNSRNFANRAEKSNAIAPSIPIEILGNYLEIEHSSDEAQSQALLAWLPFAIIGSFFSLGLSCIFWLMSVRKTQAQLNVKKVNAELSTMAKVAQHTDNSVIILNADHQVVWVNQSFERTFGISHDQGLDRTLQTLFDPEKTNFVAIDTLVQAVLRQQSWRIQLPLHKVDDRDLWFDIELQPIIDQDSICVGFVILGSEITQLREAQAHAVEQRNRWESIARASNLGVVFWDIANEKLDCNAAFAFMLGYQLEEIKNFTIHQFIKLTHENDLRSTQREIRKIISGELASSSIDVRLKHRKGHWVWANANLQSQEHNKDATASTVLLVLTDNTIAKAREDEWRARADLSADWYWRTDHEHRFVEISTGDSKISHLTAKMIGKKRDEIANYEPPSIGWPELHARMNKGEDISGAQHRDLTDPERPRWIEIQGKPVWSPNGEFLGYSGIGRDVTVNQSATEALRDSLSLVDALFEALPLPLAMKDVNGHYVRSNSAYSELFDVQPSSLFNATVSEIMDEETALIHRAEDQKVLTDKVSREYEIIQRLPTRPAINALVRKAPVLDTSTGEAVGIVAMIIDVTKQRQAEEAERRAKEEALLASKSKSAFLATMSHEIRTPMNGVLGMAELLSMSGLDADQADSVKTIRESAANLLNIIDDILDFSKIEAGHLTIENEPIDLLAIVESVADGLQQVAVQKKVRLDVFVDPSIPEQVIGDSVRLRQVLNNLVGNAIKFTSGLPDREGRVYLRISPRGNEQLHFTISDNGIGISEQSKSQLFAAFTQAERTTARRYGGTGLGLVICQRIIDAMGGKIELESEIGVGSEFSFTLTLAPVIGLFPGMDHTLEGVNCYLLNLNQTQALDWSGYLKSAGASVSIIKKYDAQTLQAGQYNVLLTNDTCLDEDIRDRADRWNAEAKNCALVIIGQGNRKQARIIKTGVVHFDLVRRHTICEAVKLAIGKSAIKPTGLSNTAGLISSTPAPSIEAAEKERRLILVAEDDPVNRKVISQQLSMIGYAAETVEDGVEALEKWRSGRFALLLTDLHMPILDGYDLTRTIRAFEGEFQRIPILALTANALTGEDTKAREAGIDAYLTKPIALSKLRQELMHWLPTTKDQDQNLSSKEVELARDNKASASTTVVVQHDSPIFDNGVLKVFVGDDIETINELLEDYLVSLESSRAQLTHALRHGKASEASSIAHRLKSSSRSVGALRLGEWCAQLEQTTSEAMMAKQSELIERFEALANEVKTAINGRAEAQLAKTS
jgi:PAS domain S-box-containing protein